MAALVFLSVGFLLVLCYLNGMTDAPNAIATAVTTRALSLRSAALLAALANILGAIFVTALNSSVADTLLRTVDLGERQALLPLAVLSAFAATSIFTAITAKAGLPTSESHGLVAAISGGALAIGGRETIMLAPWLRIGAGLLLSVAPAMLISAGIYRLALSAFSRSERRSTTELFRRGEVVAAFCSAFMHGAQDSQKFAALFLLLLGGEKRHLDVIALTGICAAFVALGTAFGGKKIIKKVGEDLTKLDAVGGFCADASSFVLLALCSAFGLPVSTTHIKTSALAGIGCSGRKKLDIRVFVSVAAGWGVTFPACFALGYVFAAIGMKII